MKAIGEALSPLLQSISHLQTQVWKYIGNILYINGMVSDVSTIINQSLRISALADASVQTHPDGGQLLLPQWQRLQSTMQDGLTESPLASPGDSAISGV